MSISRTSAARGSDSPEVTGFYDTETGSIQYLAADPKTRKAALIDVVLPFDPQSASIRTEGVEPILRFIEKERYEIEWILDTHPHADHLMASSYLKEFLGAQNAIGEKVKDIAALWQDYYNMPGVFSPENDFDRLFRDGDTFHIGTLPVSVMLSAGHTLGSVTYRIGSDAAFVHDTFMQPDVGTARADFPGGTAHDLYRSLQAILNLPDDTRLFVGHDYGTDTRTDPEWESTVAEQRRHNSHIGGGVSESDYIKLRKERDRTLTLPERMLHVLQMNLRAGKPPEPEADGNRYLKIPLNRFSSPDHQ